MAEPTKAKQAIVGLIYQKVNDLLGAGNQLFSMQFPAQPLNHRQYQYDTDDRTSVLTRPYTIAEAEFRLSDQLFDVFPITQGSTGEKLSTVYTTLINNYVPSLKPFAAYFRDRAGLSRFLRQESPDAMGSGKSRIDWCRELFDQYLQAKMDWDDDKRRTFDEIRAASEEEDLGVTLDDYAKWLSTVGLVREEGLNSLYNDAVVKGHLHEVLTILGYLNVSSIAEELEIGKQRMRHSARLSLDESMLVYPVQFQPSHWFQGLTPNLSPVDLTMAHETIRDQLRAKRRALSRAESELRVLELLSSSEEEIRQLEAQIEAGKTALNEAEGNLVSAYGQALVTAAKIYLTTLSPEGNLLKLAEQESKGTQTVADSDGPGQHEIEQIIDPAQETDRQALSRAVNGLGLSDVLDGVNPDQLLNDLSTVVNEIYTTYKSQKNVLEKAEEWTYLKSQLARAQSHDLRFQKLNLSQRIEELHADIADLGQLLAGVYREKMNPKGIVSVAQDAEDAKKWTISLPGSPTDGTFTLTVRDRTTAQIKHDTNVATLQDALDAALVGVRVARSSVTVTVTGADGGPWELLFSQDVGTIEGDGARLIVSESAVELPVIPRTGQMTEADGMFMDVIIKSTELEESSKLVDQSSATSFGWNVNGWFWSAGGQHSWSQASTDAESAFFSQDIEIGFRVAKVTFDRGGWFNPQLFKMSHAFYRLADLRAAPEVQLTKDQVLAAAGKEQPTDEVAKLLRDINNNSCSLPAYPVGMVIAKDITIKIKQDASQSKATRQVLASSTTAGGGFLGFSCNYSAASSSLTDTTFHGQQGDYFYIRIPGPQILGYYLQFVAPDNAQPYEPIYDETSSEVERALTAYDQPVQLPQTASSHGPVVEAPVVEASE